MQCQVCASDGPFRDISVREMLLGAGLEFDYCECRKCGSVQIKAIPPAEVLEQAYASRYRTLQARPHPWLRDWVRREKDRHFLGFGSPLGKLMSAVEHDPMIGILADLKLKRDSRVLDVGCGIGYLLDRLARTGMTSLVGADPFMPAHYRTAMGVPVLNVSVEGVPGPFDVVMFNHSLEHVPDAAETLRSARSKLVDGGICLVRIPTTGSEAWETYGACWAQLDAPRHVVVPSRDGMAILAKRCGLILERTTDDSTGHYQFMASEAYKRGLTLQEAMDANVFSLQEVRDFAEKAAAANAAHRGDQAAFFLRAN